VRLLIVPCLLLALSACTGPGSDPSRQADAPSPASAVPATAAPPVVRAAAEYVGLSEEQALIAAKQDGLPVRVIVRDGTFLPVTGDSRQGRVNLSVAGGRVVSAVQE